MLPSVKGVPTYIYNQVTSMFPEVNIRNPEEGDVIDGYEKTVISFRNNSERDVVVSQEMENLFIQTYSSRTEIHSRMLTCYETSIDLDILNELIEACERNRLSRIVIRANELAGNKLVFVPNSLRRIIGPLNEVEVDYNRNDDFFINFCQKKHRLTGMTVNEVAVSALKVGETLHQKKLDILKEHGDHIVHDIPRFGDIIPGEYKIYVVASTVMVFYPKSDGLQKKQYEIDQLPSPSELLAMINEPPFIPKLLNQRFE